jgi:xylan 1,4-beta-xylosidase
LSAHTYAVKTGAVDADGTALTISDTRPEAIIGRVRRSREMIDDSATPNLELHYTEWSSSYTPTDYIHDQYQSASFILEKLHETSPLAQSMSYWTFTDIFEENGPRFTPFHGGFGLLNYQGLRKPAYFAYRFLAQLGTEDIATEDSQSWITRDSRGSVQALFWDHTPIDTPPGENNQTFFRREQPAKPAPTTKLSIHGLKSGRYAVRIYRVGYQQNDVYTAYLHMGAPDQLTREQVATLQASTAGTPVETKIIKVTTGDFNQQFEMKQNDVVFVTLKRQELEEKLQ